MEKHKIGEVYEVKGQKYKLVAGEEDDCTKCAFGSNISLCHSVPSCVVHGGHYVLAEDTNT